MWQLACPWCKAHGVEMVLAKRSLWQVIRCKCGWIWGQESHMKTSETLVNIPVKPTGRSSVA